MASHRRSVFLASVAAGLLACGITGEQGVARFDVGSKWDSQRAIALGSTFEVDARSVSVFGPSLEVESDATGIFVPTEPTGSFVAATTGYGSFVAVDAESQETVDTVGFEVVEADAVGLQRYADRRIDDSRRVASEIALVTGGWTQMSVLALDVGGTRLHHAGLATATPVDGGRLDADVDGDTLRLEGRAMGQAIVDLGMGQDVNAELLVEVVEQTAIASLSVESSPGLSTPFEYGEAAVGEPDRNNNLWYLVVAHSQTADGVDVFGAQAEFQVISGAASIDPLSMGDHAWIAVESNETVAVEVTVNGLTELVVLGR